MKFIYWFAYYNTDSPSVRYRGQYPLEFFRINYGIKSHFITPGYQPFKVCNFLVAYFSALLFMKKDAIIVIQRINSNFIYANLLKLLVKVRKQHTVYDLDDADYLEFDPGTIHYFIKNCAAVTVGSQELLKNLTGMNSNIYLNTSPVPGLGILKKHKNDLLTIGWIGGFGGGHKVSLLKYCFPALRNLPFPVKLILLGVVDNESRNFLRDYFSQFKNVILEMPYDINWKDERNIQHRIAEFDIGIATLLNTEAQRSKSAFKLKQYMNNGVPVLSSDIAENSVFLVDGINGYLCRSEIDFRNRIIEFKYMDQLEFGKFSFKATKSICNFNHEKYYSILLKLAQAVSNPDEISPQGKSLSQQQLY